MGVSTTHPILSMLLTHYVWAACDVSRFRVEKRLFWDSDHENWYSYFSRKYTAFCENNLHHITYLPKSYLSKKWRKSIFQLLPLDGRYLLTVALKFGAFYKQVVCVAELNKNALTTAITLACLEIRSRNEEPINSTRNRIYLLKVFYFLLSMFWAPNWHSTNYQKCVSSFLSY